ncbi:hypothetical protein [Desulfonema magnum]|uniref:Uncharacterized protein n=1 Tax=Desulfonema magnum TaxID=45655 RepID=A0A975GSV5_9BACT|nr:hypothetical protein [Desulfonema magnum]QTA91468.1 Uncharacterized protein dnm_075350 [Desulfonema magnum]
MINFRQKELIEELMNQIGKKFPEIELIDVTESPEDPESLWINVTEPGTEERMLELTEFSGDKTMDILLDYGYHMLVMPTGKRAA